MSKFIIFCIDRSMYWRQNWQGYTLKKEYAGRYNAADANDILLDANKIRLNEIKIPEDEAPDLSIDFAEAIST